MGDGNRSYLYVITGAEQQYAQVWEAILHDKTIILVQSTLVLWGKDMDRIEHGV